MKRLFSIVPAVPGGKILVLGVVALLLNPGAEACGPYKPKLTTLHCPVAGMNFATNANHQLVVTGQAKQVKCPLTGKNPAGGCGYLFTVNVVDVNVALADAASKRKLERAKPVEQLQMVFGDEAFARGFVMKNKTTLP